MCLTPRLKHGAFIPTMNLCPRTGPQLEFQFCARLKTDEAAPSVLVGQVIRASEGFWSLWTFYAALTRCIHSLFIGLLRSYHSIAPAAATTRVSISSQKGHPVRLAA